jgi:hypothetical protein
MTIRMPEKRVVVDLNGFYIAFLQSVEIIHCVSSAVPRIVPNVRKIHRKRSQSAANELVA